MQKVQEKCTSARAVTGHKQQCYCLYNTLQLLSINMNCPHITTKTTMEYWLFIIMGKRWEKKGDEREREEGNKRDVVREREGVRKQGFLASGGIGSMIHVKISCVILHIV